MGFYEGLKDAINIAQKADNIDLYRKLLDLSRDALDLQEENSRLKQEVLELKSVKSTEEKLVHHISKESGWHMEHPYVTLKDDPLNIRYCAICWAKDKQLIQLYDELNCVCCNERKTRNT